MGLFLLVSQVCCLLAIAANGYVLFAANLEDFRNLARKIVPEKLAGKLTEIVSESSLQYRQMKADREEEDGDTGFQRGKVKSAYEPENIPGRSGNRMDHNERGNIERISSKKKRLFDNSDGEGMKDDNFERKETFKNTYVNEEEQEREYDRKDVTTTFTSKDKRYRTVKRKPSSKPWYDESSSSSFKSSKDDSLESFHYTSQKSTYEIGEKLEHRMKSTGTDYKRKKLATPTTEREIEESYNKRQTTKENHVVLQEFEYENPFTTKKRAPKQLINGRDVKHRKVKKQEAKDIGMIFDTILLDKNKGDYEEWPEKDEDYYSKEAVKTTANSRNRPRLSKKIGREHSNHDDVIENEGTTMPVGKENTIGKKLLVMDTETEPLDIEKDGEDAEEPKAEEVKARTENLLFDSKENVTQNYMMKSSGIPTRERYKMSSPDYYKKLPRIVEKYDFNEPIPEADREREKIDDRLAMAPARVNMKMKQQLETSRKPERLFKAILDELGFEP